MGCEQDLIFVVKNGDVIGVQKLVVKVKVIKIKFLGFIKRFNVNYQDVDGFFVFYYVVLGGSLEFIVLLLEVQVIVDIKDSNGMCLLYYVVWQGWLEFVKLLLCVFVVVNVVLLDGQIFFYLVVQYGYYEVLEMFF